MLSSEQVQAARVWLKWSQDELATRSGVAKTTISNFESGAHAPSSKTLARLERTLSPYFEFLPNGLRFRRDNVRKFEGREGHIQFQWDVYDVLAASGGDVCVSNVNERDSLHWLGEDEAEKYRKAMASIKQRYKFHILVQEGDDYFAASDYAEYRCVSKNEFGGASFYVYGDRLAIISYGDTVQITVVQDPQVADAYRAQFAVLWERSKTPTRR